MSDRHLKMTLPTPAPAFAWRHSPFGPALECTPLAAHAWHLFTTRGWALGSRQRHLEDPAPWHEVAEAIGVNTSQLVHPRQVHGAHVVEAKANTSPGDADILIGNDPAVAMAVQAADCVPLLLADPRTGAVAAAHAGWRGMVARAPQRAVEALVLRYGAHPSDLVAALGPSIGACCYEVGDDVLQAFVEAGMADALKRWFLDRRPVISNSPAYVSLPAKARSGHWFFDGWQCVRDELREAGLLDEQIHSPQLCTASHPALLCSYRRDGTSAGRLAAIIRPRHRR